MSAANNRYSDSLRIQSAKSNNSIRVQSMVIRSHDNLSPERNTASMTVFPTFNHNSQKLKPEFPKIVDSVMPLMYDSTYGNISTGNRYKFQDKGMPILINYRALQNKQKNQQIPVGILVEYFRQWIEIMKLQIDNIINNLYEKASFYTEKSIILFEDALAYNQKYMKYIMLSIIPSRAIHQNHSLTNVEQTLSRQNLKLTTCQHCYDFTLECEMYVEKVLCTEKIQPEVSVQKDIRDIKNKYKQLITDVECKQIFQKYTQILTQHFLEQFAQQAAVSKKIFNEYHEYRRQVGKFTTVDLMDTESYDQEDAINVFSVHLPKGDAIIEGLIQIENYQLFSIKVRQQANAYKEDMENINQKLMGSMQQAPYLMLETLEHLISAKFCLNMNLEKVEMQMINQFKNNERFLTSISKKLPSFQEKFDKYMVKQQEFNQKWNDLIKFYKQEIGPFVDKLKQGNPDQQLYIDIDSQKLFADLKQRGKKIEERYLELWKFLGDLRKELDMKVDLFEDDKEVITRELNFLDKITKTSQLFYETIYGSPFLLDDPISLMEINGLETQKQNISNFLNVLSHMQKEFDQLRNNNLLGTIFKKLTIKDPLMHSLMKKKLVNLLNQILKQPSLETIKDKIEYYNKIEAAIEQTQLKESTPQQLRDRLFKLIRNMIYCELKLTFKYEMIPQMKEKLQKSIADVLNTDIQADQNEYFQKAVQVCYEQMVELKGHLQNFNYPDFLNLFSEIEHIKNNFQVYNDVIGKQNLHIKIATYREIIDKTYKYFFQLQNPPVYNVLRVVESFLEELKQNIALIDGFLKKNFQGFENLSKILQNQKTILLEIQNEYSNFQKQLSQWVILNPSNLSKVITPIKNWLIHVHQKVYTLDSKKLKGSTIYMNTCEEKEPIQGIYDKILRNRYFGIKGGMNKNEQEKLKENFTPYKQEKYELGIDWDQKPKQTKLLLDIAIPFKSFNYKIQALNENNQLVTVLEKTGQNDNVYKTLRDEVDIEMHDIYTTIVAEITAIDEKGFKRVQYTREIVVSSLERETKLVLNELGVQFQKNEEWKIYVKNFESIMWTPLIKIGEMKQVGKNGDIFIDFIQDVDVKQKSWQNVELSEYQYGSFEFTISHANNHSASKYIYYIIIECDGCEKDLQTQDHKIFLSGKTQNLPQVFTYTMADTQAMRREKPIWMLGYIKEGIYFKTNVFVSRTEVDEHLQNIFKQDVQQQQEKQQ
ncbi:hypothetical protein TTHERM_00540130 (macronuclear) [Tetrahymena thermophila SB210]|uniref:Uncharacterized protein n=1 Tax=Tetrahymena thermophila (strain SB210) TaxID=312017 RepID=I7M0J1_TETTS|nr:hypothetical protein TTHERM_00540130 [Tetrahymena thermophila SB210]EAR87693.2 hypothetical protein TTHERM_00540130 [Tetrahymena thermophila SB210]|eukprot:XP_001007938.2 hypothetical protein TTHERM_00540130 [Tetrahymena thermophila SB210]